jgi:prevent-host-death family protein
MTKFIDALTARTRFGELMEKAVENKTRFLVSRRGKPKVVVMSVEDYLNNIVKRSTLLTEIQMDAKKAGLDLMSLEEITSEIHDARTSQRSKQK